MAKYTKPKTRQQDSWWFSRRLVSKWMKKGYRLLPLERSHFFRCYLILYTSFVCYVLKTFTKKASQFFILFLSNWILILRNTLILIGKDPMLGLFIQPSSRSQVLTPRIDVENKRRGKAAKECLNKLVESGHIPNVITYTAVMKCCFRCRQFEQGLKIFAGMRRKEYTYDTFAYGTVVVTDSGCTSTVAGSIPTLKHK